MTVPVPEPTWPPSGLERDDAERREAAFRLRLHTWLVRKHGRRRRLGRLSRLVVRCRHCRRLVMMPTRLGLVERERLRLHLTLHMLAAGPSPAAEELLRHFEVKAQGAR